MAKTLDQLKREAARLQEQIAFIEASEAKYAQVAVEIRQVVRDRGLELAEVLRHLSPTVQRPPRGLDPKKEPASRDKSGAMPVKGTTYHHRSVPEDWTCAGNRTPNVWLDIVRKGATWKSLEAK